MESLHIELAAHEVSATLSLSGRFDFKTRLIFKDAMTRILASSQLQTIELELSKLNYLDSSALGLLLDHWSEAKSRGIQVTLSNPRGSVAQALDIAQFNKLFTIRGSA